MRPGGRAPASFSEYLKEGTPPPPPAVPSSGEWCGRVISVPYLPPAPLWPILFMVSLGDFAERNRHTPCPTLLSDGRQGSSCKRLLVSQSLANCLQSC